MHRVDLTVRLTGRERSRSARDRCDVPLDDLLLIPGFVPQLTARELQRGAENGAIERIGRGAYVDRREWSLLRADERALLRALGHARQHPEAVLSHSSAALLHGLPVAIPPTLPEVLRLRSQHDLGGIGVRARSSVAPAEATDVDGVRVVPLERTVLDLAATLPFREALAPIDGFLARGGSRDALDDLLGGLRIRGARRAEVAIAHGDAGAANGGESLSRGTVQELGFPLPVVQMPVPGTAHQTDLGWPEFELRGELDGFQKYVDPHYTDGRTPAQIVFAEKRREDEIRLITGHRFVRWTFEDALRVHPLRRALLRAGLPQQQQRRAR